MKKKEKYISSIIINNLIVFKLNKKKENKER